MGFQITGLGAGAARHLGKETGQRDILLSQPLKGEELKEGGNVLFQLLVRLVGVSKSEWNLQWSKNKEQDRYR